MCIYKGYRILLELDSTFTIQTARDADFIDGGFGSLGDAKDAIDFFDHEA